MKRREYITKTAIPGLIGTIVGCSLPESREFQPESYVNGQNWPLDRANPRNTAAVDVQIEWSDPPEQSVIFQADELLTELVSVDTYLWYSGTKIGLFDLNTSESVWEATPQAQINVSPAVANKRVYLGTLRHLTAYSYTEGEKLWEDSQDVVDTALLTKNGLVFAENKSGQQLEKKSAKTGNTLAKYEIDHSLQGIAVSDDRVFLTQLGESTGEVVSIDWHEDTIDWTFSDCGGVTSSPVLTPNFLIFGSQDGSVYCLDRGSGTIVWSTAVIPQNEGVFTDLAVSDDAVFISANNGDHCLALEVSSGKRRWQTETGMSMLGPICGSKSVLTANRDTLYQLDTGSGAKRNQTTFSYDIQDLCLTKNGLFVAAGPSLYNLSS